MKDFLVDDIMEACKMTKRYKLLKDLPACPAGSIFKIDEDFHAFKIGFPEKWNDHTPNIPQHLKFSEEFMKTEPTWFEPIEERWKPGLGDHFWRLDEWGKPYETVYGSGPSPFPYLLADLVAFGNCFRTEKQADEAYHCVRQALQKYHEEIGE